MFVQCTTSTYFTDMTGDADQGNSTIITRSSPKSSCNICSKGYEDWMESSEYCYKFPENSVPGNFWQAEAVCKYEHNGGKLIVVDTPELNNAVAQKLEDIGPNSSCIIDLQGEISKLLLLLFWALKTLMIAATNVWTHWHQSHQVVRYQPWEPDQPNIHDEGRCAFVYGNGLWKMLPCTKPAMAPCMKKKTTSKSDKQNSSSFIVS